MTESHSTPSAKPAKPRPDFPLFPHAAGVWAKKIRGKLYYFGPRDDPDGALKKYDEQKDALHAGRMPRPDSEGLTVKALANDFLNHKKARLETGELSARSWAEYKAACDLLVSQFGKSRLVEDLGPEDFATLRKKMAQRWGPYRLKNTMQYIRSLFKYAADNDLIARAVRYGQGFERPSQKTIRLHRARQGAKLFSAEEIRRMVDAAGTPLKAMLLLAINCGFGNADCGTLPLAAVNLDTGWIDYPRPKTGIPRRCPLWPETVAAIREALARRPEPKDRQDAGLVFLTQRGLSWARANDPGIVTKETTKLLRVLGINGDRNFYTLRQTFRTVADESKDQPAVDYIMGHEVPHMSSVYRETIADERLRGVALHVRAWLFPPANA